MTAQRDSTTRDATTQTAHDKAVRLVLILLFGNLGLSIVFAALTLVFRDSVLDHQVATTGQARDQLALTLWTRPIPILLVSLGYLWVARQLRRGVRSAYLRVRTISAVGVLAVGYLLLTGAYPGWLRAVQVGQLALLAALVFAVNRRVLRAGFAKSSAGPRRAGNRWAALTLVAVAPSVAELTLGTVPMRMLWLVLLYVPIYGAGVLLVRELVRRAGGGWLSVLLLGLAYGLVEEGLALQSLTSPRLYGAAGWVPRLFGVNTAYTELNLPYHAVFSVAIPIALVELLFPSTGKAPYLRAGGVVGAGIVALLGAGLVRVSVPPAADPGYLLPLPAFLAILASIAVLGVLALRVLPGVVSAARPGNPPRPLAVGLSCGAAALGFLGLLFPFGGATQPAFTHGDRALLPMLAAAVLAGCAGFALRRWAATTGWTGRHRLAAITGALVAHTAFGVVAQTHTALDRISLVALGVATVVLLGLLDRRLRAEGPASTEQSASRS
ncbi:hypothetical protein F0L68_18540 [Solihabitans fulvus]|uniref:Uncharacterized protein n=1 Tax=Solihabitans fulvus TaxID=1892852 RepID=A0A5B2XD08_9PSEU|nr:hypothetical protein [Solihabitans fulvus]KAA2261064.1 hypothetical protein F0L68_18540 [Solihabitans fulvus]